MFVTVEQLMTSPHGVACRFVKMGNAGLKTYYNKETRDGCYRLQRLLHREGLAPYCWFPFNFTGPNGDTIYAFYTDIAEVMDRKNPEHCPWEWGKRAHSMREEIQDRFGFTWYDDHCGNVGIIDGKDVMIDCDPRHCDGANGWMGSVDPNGREIPRD